MRRRIPDWLLERQALGELPEGDWLQWKVDPEARARLDALEASNRRILAEYPPEAMGASIRRRSLRGAARPRELRRIRTWAAVGAASLASVFVLLSLPTPTAPPIEDEVRTKGLDPHLVVHRKRDQGPERIGDGADALRGDVIQIGYVAAGRAYGMILSIDGRGGVTVHLPEDGADAAAMEPAGTAHLPHAYELDDAPDFERFIFVTAARAFSVHEVLTAARKAAALRDGSAPLPLPPHLEQSTFLLRKR